jgi:hypothetical protein
MNLHIPLLSTGLAVSLSVLVGIPPGIGTTTEQVLSPIPLQPGRHLFVDDFLVAESVNLNAVLHQPEKLPGPMIGGADTEDQCGQPYTTVLRDPETKRFRIWYNTLTREGEKDLRHIATMESEDGLHWIRPKKKLLDISGGYDCSVLDEGPTSIDPSRRFRLAFWENLEPVRYNLSKKIGLCVAFSPDGLKWTRYEGNPVLADQWQFSPENDPKGMGDPRFKQSTGDIVDCVRDTIHGGYLVCIKSWTQPPTEFGPVSRSYAWGRRLVSQTTSQDFIQWTPIERILVPDEKDEGDIEFYGCKPVVRGNQLVGFVRILHDDVANGIGYTVLATSNDGHTWNRMRNPFLPRNEADPAAWDHAVCWVGDCLTVEDKEYLYFGAYSGGHKQFDDRTLGVATLRKDGFLSRQAGSEGGRLMTKPLILPVGGISVNADVQGELRVRILDEKGVSLEGLDWRDCVPIQGDSVNHAVTWTSGRRAPAGITIRLEFQLHDANLYAFCVGEASLSD